MKIGITCYPTYGGSGAVATELGIGLAAHGHEVHFISYAQPFRLAGFHERVYFHEVEVDSYPLFEHPPYTLALAAAIHATAVRERLDVVHVHYAIPHATSAWIAREMLEGDDGPPLVTTLHGTDVTLVGQHPSLHAITRFSILRSQRITAVSHYLKRETVRDFGIPGERIEVIPNFVDTDRYRRDRGPSRREVFAPGNEKIVAHVSNFRPLKRVSDVVGAFAGIRKRMPARLVMVGDGPDRPRAEERARALGVRDDVVFLGKHVAVEEILASTDLFLMASENESFGLAALEAMSCGAPVVAYRAGGVPEVVADGETGFLVPTGGVDEAAEAGARVLGDAALWERFSRAGRRAAEESFGTDSVLPMYEACYESVRKAPGEPGDAGAGTGGRESACRGRGP